MPGEGVRFLPRREILTFEEITRFVRVCAGMGIRKVRLTGGEPLVRAEVARLVEQLVQIPGIDDVAMTTNGLLLGQHAEALRRAGLHRLNVSLDTLNEETFQRIARRSGVQQVLEGIDRAIQVGFTKIRLNAVAIRGITEAEVIPLAEFARERHLELRFIEFMPLDAEHAWQRDLVLKGEEIRALMEQYYGPLEPAPRPDPSQPAVDYFYAGGQGVVGFINPVTQPFCHECNRLRITAEGQVRNCLFSTQEWDARRLLRSGASDEEIADLVRECVGAKKPGHGIDQPDFVRPARAMFEIGG
jgi:cyclic pyranopterin phosphate synthase